MSSGYNEKALSPESSNIHRALASVQEELEAIDYYQQRVDTTDDVALKAILAHNRDEEVEHATMLLEWLRRKMPQFDNAMKTYLFTSESVTEIEGKAGSSESPNKQTLGIGNMK